MSPIPKSSAASSCWPRPKASSPKPQAASPLDRARKLIQQDRILPDETTVLCITGNGLKTTDVLADKYQAEIPIAPKLAEFEAYLAAKSASLPAAVADADGGYRRSLNTSGRRIALEATCRGLSDANHPRADAVAFHRGFRPGGFL